MQFSHNGTFEAVRLDDPSINSMSAFKTAVKNLQWIAGGTFTPSALKFAYDNLIRNSKRARAKVSVVVITDGRFDPRDDEDLLRYLCEDSNVVVNAIGVGDMFQKQQDDEILGSIACNKKERVTAMRRYSDLVAEDFIETMETVLCPGKTGAVRSRSDPAGLTKACFHLQNQRSCVQISPARAVGVTLSSASGVPPGCSDPLVLSEPRVSPCIQRPVDLVFLLDGSERLGANNFRYAREFVQKVSDRLVLARSRTDRMRARLALLEFGKNETEVAFPLTHDRAVISQGIAGLPYFDSSSVVAPAILQAIDTVLGKGPSRKTRRNSEISFVFITDGVTDSRGLDEAVSAMRRAQVVPTVVATGPDVDREVLAKLAMGDQEAIFKPKDFSDLSQSALFDRFLQWVC